MATQSQRRANRAKKGEATNQYDAAGSGRRMRGWNPPNVGPNRAIKGLEKIRARSQDVVRNDWSGESSVQKWSTALVGVGIVPRWSDDAITKLWATWSKVADADGVLDVYGMQALAVRSWLASGEVFVRRRPRASHLDLPVPLQVQLIESEFCPAFDATSWPGMPEGNTINQGIERTRYGERAAYWMFKAHPGDGVAMPGQNDLIRIPAREVRHVFEVKRPGQLRGVSSLAPVLARLRATGDFEDAVLERQKLANLFTLFITRSMPDDWEDIDIDADTGLPKWYGDDGLPVAGLEPGISHELKPGEDIKFANPPEAGVTFSDYLRTTTLGTSAGQGLPYELFSGDIANVSDRTLRIIIQEFRRFAEQRQWHTIIPMLCQPIVEWWADAAVLSGALAMGKLAAAKSPDHSPHGWDYIHPVQDVQGKVLAIENGLASRTGVITSRGDDPRKIDAERAADNEREKSLRLKVESPPEPSPDAPSEPQTKPQPQQSVDLAHVIASMAQMMSTLGQMVGSMHASAAQGQSAALATHVAPPQFVVHNHLPEPTTTVNVAAPSVTVEAPSVTVTNDVRPTPVSVDAPNVNVTVEAPNVSVTNEVQPAEVNVQLPDRETRSVIKRNSQGDIVDVTQVERTIQ